MRGGPGGVRMAGVGVREAGGAAAVTVAIRPVIITNKPNSVACAIPIQSSAIPKIP